MNSTRLLGTSLLAILIANIPASADACWDGVSIATERVSLSIASDAHATWSPEQARRWAKWVARIDALVPEGKTLLAEFGTVEICDDATDECTELETTWENDDAFTLFELTADAVAASNKTIAAARRTTAMPLTVQIAASHDLDAATKLAARVNAAGLELSGFLDIGGFPAMNEYAHVVVSADHATFQVVVGAFLARSEADAVATMLDAELGLHGFVRPLDQWTITEEGC